MSLNAVPAIVATAYAITGTGAIVEVLATTDAVRASPPPHRRRRAEEPAANAESKKGKGKRRIERRAIRSRKFGVEAQGCWQGAPARGSVVVEGQRRALGKTLLGIRSGNSEGVGLDPNKVTPYALRHSWIASLLVHGLPINSLLIAADVTAMIQADLWLQPRRPHTDEVLRSTLSRSSMPTTDKVAPLR